MPLRGLLFLAVIAQSSLSYGKPVVAECARGHVAVVSGRVCVDKPAPDFPLEPKQKYFSENPILHSETALLELIGIHLFPSAEGFEKEEARATLDEWQAKVSAYLIQHRNDSKLQELVKEYLVEYGNHPAALGYLPGDAQWDTPRTFSDWTEFFDAPREHDLDGNALKVGGKFDPSLKEKLSGKDFHDGPKMYVQVKNNLRSHEGLAEIVRENSMPVDRVLPQIAYIRREFLQLSLINFGEQMWRAERAKRPR